MLSHSDSAKWYCVLPMVATTGVGGMSLGSFASKQKLWGQLCRRMDRQPTSPNDRICSCHFKEATKDGDPVYFRHNDG